MMMDHDHMMRMINDGGPCSNDVNDSRLNDDVINFGKSSEWMKKKRKESWGAALLYSFWNLACASRHVSFAKES